MVWIEHELQVKSAAFSVVEPYDTKEGEGAVNPIDEIYARIEQISSRIRQIQQLGERPPGQTAPNPVQPPTGNSVGAETATGSGSVDSAATVRSPEFQKLLQEAMALGQSGGQSADAAGAPSANTGLGNLTGIDSLLGQNPVDLTNLQGASGEIAGGNAARLKAYQNALIQAVQQLQAQQGKTKPTL